VSVAARRPSGGALWIAAAVSLGLSLTPWGAIVLYPFKLFTTWVHECGHALVTVLVGGRVQAITIAPDTSGLTLGLVPAGVLARGLVASAGYLGAALVGCLLMAAARVQRWAHTILLAAGGCLLLTAVFWMRNLFGFVVVLAWGAALVALGRRGAGDAARFVLGLLAVQVALNAVYDIRVLFLVRGGPSDAETMARLFLLPASLWATAWMVLSVALLGATLWLTRDRR
jgi:peptidase M50B-like protein